MPIVQDLMDAAVSDVDVLYLLDAQGDDFSKFRDVDFLFRCPDKEKADILASFINEYHYGVATAFHDDEESTVQVIINMPVQQHIILSVSGFMTCLATLYGSELDGWGCVAQTETACPEKELS